MLNTEEWQRISFVKKKCPDDEIRMLQECSKVAKNSMDVLSSLIGNLKKHKYNGETKYD